MPRFQPPPSLLKSHPSQFIMPSQRPSQNTSQHFRQTPSPPPDAGNTCPNDDISQFFSPPSPTSSNQSRGSSGIDNSTMPLFSWDNPCADPFQPFYFGLLTAPVTPQDTFGSSVEFPPAVVNGTPIPQHAPSRSSTPASHHSGSALNHTSTFQIPPPPQYTDFFPHVMGMMVQLPTQTTPQIYTDIHPSPTPFNTDEGLPQTISVEPPGRPLYTHREQLQFFRNVPPESGLQHLFVPQQMYKPHTNSDRRRYVEDVSLEEPIYFWSEHPAELGITLCDALRSRVKRLQCRDEPVFEGRGPSVSIRLEWGGYGQWSRQIPTKDFRSPPCPITRAKLAKNVAKCVLRFIDEKKGHAMEEEADERWKVGDGPGQIKFTDLVLVSLHHVSMGSWQPQLRLREGIRY